MCVSRRGTSDERKIIRASCVPLSLVPSAPDRGTQDSGIDMITMINTRIHWNRKIPERICCRRREKEGKGTQRERERGRGREAEGKIYQIPSFAAHFSCVLSCRPSSRCTTAATPLPPHPPSSSSSSHTSAGSAFLPPECGFCEGSATRALIHKHVHRGMMTKALMCPCTLSPFPASHAAAADSA